MSVATPDDGGSTGNKKIRIVSHLHYRISRSEKVIATALLIGVVILALIPFTFFLIPAGHVGVLYRTLSNGTETGYVYHEGIGIKFPWNRIYRYEVRTQTRDEDIHALAENGLSVQVAISVLFHPVPDSVGKLHQAIGTDYVERIVRPIIIGAVRDIVGKFGPHDLYRVKVTEFKSRILDSVRASPAASAGLIDFQRVVVRDLVLPTTLNDAINEKLTEEQRAQAYEFLITQAGREAERKRIEAIGIQTFYSIVANALTPQLLTWRGIEATVELSKSNNTKIVVVGGGKDQLPLILGSDIANQPNLPNPSPIDPQSHPLPSLEDLPKLFPDNAAKAPSQESKATGAGSSEPEPKNAATR